MEIRHRARFPLTRFHFNKADMDPFSAETARIVEAYEYRRQTIPPERYSFFSPGNMLDSQEVEREIIALLRSANVRSLSEKLVLEVGCGRGGWLREFIKWGAIPGNLVGIDLLPERIEEAKKLCPQGVRFECGNAARLAFANDCFDVALQSTVFSSILDRSLRNAVAAEMLRVLKPQGFIIWYDFYLNNPNNPDVRGIREHEIRELFAGCSIRLHRVTLAPPIGRIVGRYSSLLYILLSRTKILSTHYIGLIKK